VNALAFYPAVTTIGIDSIDLLFFARRPQTVDFGYPVLFAKTDVD
jgi:hypothetical protein